MISSSCEIVRERRDLMFDVRGRMLYKRSMTTTQNTKKLTAAQTDHIVALRKLGGIVEFPRTGTVTYRHEGEDFTFRAVVLRKLIGRGLVEEMLGSVIPGRAHWTTDRRYGFQYAITAEGNALARASGRVPLVG